MATDDAKCVPQISAEDEKEYEKQFKERGVDGCLKFIKEKQDSWKQVPINIGIIGNSGVGKSSFINTIRCLDDEDDPNFAKVGGGKDCTEDIHPYEYPGNPKLKFWDLPGISAKYPREKYQETIKFKQYDFFFIISASRFTENDQWLAKSITDGGKQLYFVRTKIGSDIDNDQKAYPKKHKNNPEGSVKSLIESIRQDITKNMQDLKVQCKQFLVDSYDRHRNFDFNKLVKCLTDDFPVIKRDALILSLSALSTDMVNKKVEIIEKRIWKAAMLSAAGAAIPIPGVSLVIDFAILTDEVFYYFKQLGLDPETVRKTSQLLAVDENRVNKIITEALPLYAVMCSAGNGSADAIMSIAMQLMKIPIPILLSEEFARYIPFIGSLIAAPISLCTTAAILKMVLRKFQIVAHLVVNVYIGTTM
jgi:predicted GTPase